MTDWLSFWNTTQRRKSAADVGVTYRRAFVPWGRGKVHVGDTIFAVGIDNGDLLLITDLHPERVRSSRGVPGQVDIWSDGTRAPIALDRVVPQRVVDRIRFRRADGSEGHFTRDDTGRLRGQQFQGRASLRALKAGVAEQLVETP